MNKNKNSKDLPVGVYKVKLSYKKSGESSYGIWHLYNFQHNGEWYSHFAKDWEKPVVDSGNYQILVTPYKDGKVAKIIEPDDIEGQQQNVAIPVANTTEAPNWDKINWAKCKTLFSVAAFEKGMELNEETKVKIEAWADYAMEAEHTKKGAFAPAPPKDYKFEETINVDDLPF